MIQLQHEDGETISNLINSAKIDLLWPNWDTETRNNYISDLILEATTANGCRFIKAVDDGADGATFTENSEKNVY